jgi:preprotein translocase subunit YajC
MKFAMTVALGALMAAPLAAQTATPAPAAQAAAKPTLAVGTTVYDPAGGTVGTIEAVSADAVTLSTGTTKVALPATAFGTSEKGTAIGMTKAELEAAAASAAAGATSALKSKLVAGAQVYGQSGATPIGTVKDAAGDLVTLTTPKGDVRLPVAGFAAGADGKIVIGMTAAEFDAAVSGAAGASAAPAPAPAPAQ